MTASQPLRLVDGQHELGLDGLDDIGISDTHRSFPTCRRCPVAVEHNDVARALRQRYGIPMSIAGRVVHRITTRVPAGNEKSPTLAGRGVVVGTFAVSFVLAFLRRPETLTRPQFFNEDGPVFYLGTYLRSPLENLVTHWAGYLHVIPRMVAYAERAVPVVQAPLVGNLVALGIAATVSTFVALGPLPGARGLRAILALLIVLAPISWEVSGSMTYVQFYLAIFLFTFAFVERPSRWWLPVFVLVAFTGPYSVLVAPVYAYRLWRDRSLWPFVLTVAAAAVTTIAITLSVHRHADAPLGDLAWNVARRVVDSPVLGQPMTELADVAVVPIAVVLLVLFASATRAVPRGWLLALGYAWAVTVAIALFVRGDGSTIDGDLLYSGRYFFAPSLVVAALVVIAAWHRPRSAAPMALAALLALGVVTGFRLQAMPDTGWREHANCIGGPNPCTVPGWFTSFSMDWPGHTPMSEHQNSGE